jgi:hypothetical protein
MQHLQWSCGCHDVLGMMMGLNFFSGLASSARPIFLKTNVG